MKNWRGEMEQRSADSVWNKGSWRIRQAAF
jgi:hypothetical protein